MWNSKRPFDEPAILFEEAELRAERLVAIVRIVVSTTLAATFATTVLPETPDADPVLVRQAYWAAATMLGYFTLGVVSLTLIKLGLYRPQMAWIAVTGDCAFLLINIWVGLGNTGLDANYLIALPPIWLAPVVLSAGALRFNPLLQAYVVGLLICGLVAIAAFNTDWTIGFGKPLQQSAEFLFAWPPNIMRLMMLVLAGAILVVASARARMLLIRAIDETRKSVNLTRYLPQQIAGRLAETGIDELRKGKRQNVAILFVDIRGFTGLSESMQPEALSAFVTEFRRRVARAVDASGGTIDKFIGDAAMVVFGILPGGSNEATDALTCADLILGELADWNESRVKQSLPAVHVGIGVHWGEAFCGAIGDETRIEYTVLGDAVNVASRLEALTKEVQRPLIVSHDVLERAERDVGSEKWQILEQSVLRGRADPIIALASSGV